MDGVQISWDKKHTDDLLNKTQKAYNTEINDLLLSAFTLALANWQQIDSVSFNLEGHGREECVSGVDTTRTVGWFTSLFPVALSLPEIKDINNLLEIGCGSGGILYPFHKMKLSCTGVDYDEAYMEYGRLKGLSLIYGNYKNII